MAQEKSGTPRTTPTSQTLRPLPIGHVGPNGRYWSGPFVGLTPEEAMAEGQRRVEAQQAREHEKARQAELERRVRLWEQSGVDARHAPLRLDEFMEHEKWADALKRARRIVERNAMLVLLGDRGNGKTQLAVELIRQTCNNLKSAVYVRSREIGMCMRRAYGSDASITEIAAVDRFVAPHLLVIDECQERPDSDWEIRTLTLLLDKRYGAMKPTVMIANCTDEQFKDLMGSSIVDRLKEGGGRIMFDWPSFRQGCQHGG